MVKAVYVFSSRQEDVTLAKELATRMASAKCIQITDPFAYREPLEKAGVVLWDIDSPCNWDSSSPAFIKNTEILLRQVKPWQIITISNMLLSEIPALLDESKTPSFELQHLVLRRDLTKVGKILERLMRIRFSGQAEGLKALFPEAKLQSITIRASDQKLAASDATENVLKKLGIDPRVSARVSQAVDELLTNAIFDAARDREDRPVRQFLDRNVKFAFQGYEKVVLEIATSGEFTGISVSDVYGSLSTETFLKYLWQNYADSPYKLKKYSGPGAGLGLYGIARSGLSLITLVQPKKRTEAILLFPNSKTYKQFKSGFQLISSLVIK